MKSHPSNNPNPAARSRARLFEILGVIGLAGLLAFFLAMSWRRWPDPVIDFGRELYLPWRLSQGAVLYRDVDDIYGPLSQYLNAALFTTCGPGLMILAAANFLVLLLILALAYLLFRRAWGVGAALTSIALFISVFALSQFTDLGNFNYLTPYSEETTHGFLVCLVLVFVLVRWVERGSRPGSFLAGFLFGLTLVLKAELVLAAGLLLAAAVACRVRRLRRADFIHMALGAALPTFFFTALFACSMTLTEAASAASRAWLNVLTTTRYTSYSLELGFIGFDHPWVNLRNEIYAFLFALVLFIGLACAARATEKITSPTRRVLLLGLLVIATFWFSIDFTWTHAARCLPGLMLLYVVLAALRLPRSPEFRRDVTRLLLAVLALALLARMILAARICDYGYYQAALAAMLVPAVLLAEVPAWVRLGRRGARALTLILFTFLLPGVVSLAAMSRENLAAKTIPVGTGLDRFYSSRYDPTGALVDSATSALRAGPRTSTLLVLPEGVMLNYLARLPSPIAPLTYFATTTTGGREDRIVASLQARPPDLVAIISRPLFEYGIPRYGAETDEGRQLIGWVKRNYQPTFARGGNPLDPTIRGVMILTPAPDADFR